MNIYGKQVIVAGHYLQKEYIYLKSKKCVGPKRTRYQKVAVNVIKHSLLPDGHIAMNGDKIYVTQSGYDKLCNSYGSSL